MPEYIRALLIIVISAMIFFAFAKQSACAITETENFTRRRNIWFAMTIAAFMAHNFWLYVVILVSILIYARKFEPKPLSLFLFTMFALPLGIVHIPGFGIINSLFAVSHLRVLSLIILLPVFLSLRRQSETSSFGSLWPDRALIAYIILDILLFFIRGNSYAEPTLTSTMREVFYRFLDIFLPYYVISRSLKNMLDFRDALLSFLLPIVLIALLANFESYKGWILYSPLTSLLQYESALTGYMRRGDLTRAVVTAGHAIALGYLMVVGIGLYLFLQRHIQHRMVRWFAMVFLVAGLIASVSRGPWVGGIALIIVFIATGRYAVRRFVIFSLVLMLLYFVASIFPGGEKLINMLPYIGTAEKENVTYREDLFANSMIVIDRNFWFGSVDYLYTPEMEAMRQGEGIIDIVNSFIGVALEQGVIGLSLFISFFVFTLWGIYQAMRLTRDKGSHEYLLGQSLLATIVGILVTITTVSSITIIPIVYWCVAGIGVAYAQMVRKNTV